MGIQGFICDPCRCKDHKNCPGKGQCDCQHRVKESNAV